MSNMMNPTTNNRRGLSERELQRREEQLAKTFGYQSDLIHNQYSIIQNSSNFTTTNTTTNSTPSFNHFLTSISTSEIGRKKRKPNHVCHAPVNYKEPSFERKEKKPNPLPLSNVANSTTTSSELLKYKEPSFPAPDRSIQYEFMFQDGSVDCLKASIRTPISEVIRQYSNMKGRCVEGFRCIVESNRVNGHETGEYFEEEYYKTPVDSIIVDVLVEQCGR